MILFGLPNCDTCRKARASLTAAGHSVVFRDVRSDPLDENELREFLDLFGDRLVNRASTTWRGLSEDEKSRQPGQLLGLYPALMKRPVIRSSGNLYLGWSTETRARLGVS